MLRRDINTYLHDIIECCDAITQYTTGRTLDSYRSERGFRAQVEREFITIGEALNNAVKLDPHLEPRITSCRAIIGLRNRLVHGYEAIDHGVVWAIATSDVPVLREQVTSMRKT